MGSGLEPEVEAGDGEGPAGRCIARSELRRFETSTEKVLEARRRRTYDREEASAAVVLTACQRDRLLLRPTLHFLANESDSLFVDVRDGGVPDEGAGDYVAWLRDCLARDGKLVLVATQEGLTSPWVPWQLGLSEGVLGLENVAVLPVADYGYFRGSPLLGLYPVIRRCQGSWTVIGPHGRMGPRLGEWLTA